MEMQDVKKSMVRMLADLFGLRIPNPVVDFWFCGKDAMEDGTAEKPADFEQYKLIEEKADTEGVVWQCYGKKAVAGCFARSYWHK